MVVVSNYKLLIAYNYVKIVIGFLILPVYNLIDQFPLLCRAFSEVDAGGGDVLVAQEVSEEGDVLIALQELLGV